MTFNILEGGIDENGSRIDFIKEVIKEASPDFLALQEAYNFEKDNDQLLKEVSQHTGLQYYALSPGRILEDGKQYHAASFSRYPFKEKYLFSGSQFQNAALFTVIDSSVGELSICNIHLHIPLNFEEAGSEDKRLKELEIILGHISRYKNLILLGDFNSISRDDNYDLKTLEVEPRFDVTSKLARDYVDVASYLKLEDRSTHPTPINKNPSYTMPVRIDYIFVSSSLAPRIQDATVIKTPISEQASDHYPFMADIS